MDITLPRALAIASRPRTLPAAVAPVLVGSGLALGEGRFRLDAMAAALVGALAIQVAANFANDASDARRGADANRVGPPRMVAAGVVTPHQMWLATWATLGVAALAGVYLFAIAGWVVAAIGVVSVLAMLGYVGGPLPYGYRGLGELSVFTFFGLVATVGTRYVHDGGVSSAAWWLGGVMGLLASAILVANNLRDLDTDAAAGKRTLAVILGRGRTRNLYTALLAVAFAMIVTGPVLGYTPPATALAGVLAGWAVPLIGTARTATRPADLIGLLGGTARLQLLVGAALAVAATV